MSQTLMLSDHDLRFVAETLWGEGAEGRTGPDRLRVRGDLLDVALEDDRLVQRLLGDEQILIRVSPRLVFTVLLRRVSRDLQARPYTLERTPAETIAVFDAPRVRRFIAEPAIGAYLVDLLTSFVRTETITVWVRRGERYRRRRFSTMSLEDMIEFAALAGGDEAPGVFRRIADIALFTSGIFPEHLRPGRGAAGSARIRSVARTMATYEEHGRRFYRLAADRAPDGQVLALLADEFPAARKSLEMLSDRYLRWTRSTWFYSPA